MQIDWDVGIRMDDGTVLRADVFRPARAGRYPVLLSYGPYAKGLAFQDGYPSAWQKMVADHPDVPHGSSNLYQNWEVVDPEKWVPDGYVCVRVDSRGCGRSPGYVDHFSPRETRDFHDCIEWAGVQPWCNGKVGLSGVSYFGINQWQVAGLQPPHLAAMCIWEGAADWYRDMTHHGGILSTFWANWYDMQVKTVQYGLGERGPRSRANPALAVCGDETMSDAQLAANRCSFGDDILAHPLEDDYHRERSAQWDRITVPFLSAGNWGGQGLHLRGNTEAFMRAASSQKWLEMHGLEHWTHFYTDYGLAIQKRFFGHFLKGERTGWDEEPPVRLQVRHVDHFEERTEREWPIARTQWTKLHLAPEGTLGFAALTTSLPGEPQDRRLAVSAANPSTPFTLSFDAQGDGLTFLSEPLPEATEITGPLAAKLWASSSTTDADLFLVFRVFTADLREVTFAGAIDPHTPVAQGWLRASHRELDAQLSREGRPYHTHAREQKLTPGAPVELDIELWPTSIVVPAGCRIALTVRGRDYVYAEKTGLKLSNFKNELRGCGPFLHDDPRDRPAREFAGRTTLHFGPAHPAWLVLPVIPAP
ncbi:CocE/NonD family hydrolase [Ramlibacter ginsenosidimutans]|uniref:CocE/NonD family hydrolase n=2 Tax=Ramlibacter ginsenosidimutans TaxID=502333 RepID=A0A934TR29_9BURK|nr:CocE/NonD family hydrolase [Ramlibacter ginsenosidimutans]